MQKKLIALAVAATISAPAYADVTVYGIMDAGVYSNSSGAAANASTSGVASSGYSTSRLGFKGTEAISDSLSARFALEAEVVPTSGSIVAKSSTLTAPVAGTAPAPGSTGAGNLNMFKRAATVGLVSTNFGSIDIGRQNTPEYAAQGAFDATGSNTGGLVANFSATSTDRVDNSILYTSPVFAGFSGKLLYSSQFSSGFVENNVVTSAGNFTDLQVAYADGAISANIGTQSANNVNAAGTLYNNTYVMAKYNFGVASVSGGFIDKANKSSATTGLATPLAVNTKNTWIGVNVPVNEQITVGLIAQKISAAGGTAGNDANDLGLSATYALNKKAKLYAAYSSVSNKGTANQGLTVATGGTFTTTAGKNASLFMTGINYSF
ncbi:MAG: porin [Gallionella sp.]